MSEIKAGVVVVTRFCNAVAKEFGEYINYIDREEAKRQDHLSEYNLYNDYMDNPEKTTGLFSKDKLELTLSEKKTLKNVFKVAQKNGSIMWQTVISFDNRWLAQHGLYDSQNKIVDERKLKELATGAVERMLKNEGLENAVWSAAIHYNTDNVHIHIATVEPVPMREKKEYTKYEKVKNNGKIEKRPILDQDGNEVKSSEYVGVFKGKSIELCKKYMVDNIINQKQQNIIINQIIREQIVKQKKNNSLAIDPELKSKFIELHRMMPRSGNRGLWNYNNNIMSNLHPMIDALSEMYIKKYHPEEFEELKVLLKTQSEIFHTAYGQDSPRDFETSKMEELYSRMGNAVLKEIREFDKKVVVSEDELINNAEISFSEDQLQQTGMEEIDIPNEVTDISYSKDEAQQEDIDVNNNSNEEKKLDNEEQMNFVIDKFQQEGVEENSSSDEGRRFDNDNVTNSFKAKSKYVCEWSKKYKFAKECIFESKKNFQKAFELLQAEERRGNVLAVYDLGDMYRFGRGTDINVTLADKYFKASLEMFNKIYEDGNKISEKTAGDEKKTNGKNLGPYLEYRIGKQFYMGLGTETNYTLAREWFEKAVDKGNRFAAFSLGNIYYYGLDIEQNFEKATLLYEKAENSNSGNPFASYKLGDIYAKGQGMKIPDNIEAEKHYRIAYDKFVSIEKENPNDNIQYRIGYMLLNGIGIEKDLAAAKDYLQLSADAGNSLAQYRLAKILIETGEKSELGKALIMLEKSAGKGNNAMAQYALGKIYLNDKLEFFDEKKAIYWFKKAANQDNQFAQYSLGKFYLKDDNKDEIKAEVWLNKAANQNNEYAQFSLGSLYLKEESIVYDYKKGIEMLQKAADQGNQFAQYSLGRQYLNADTPVFDLIKGIEMLQKAADQGNQFAQYSLGRQYLNEDSPVFDLNKGIEMLQKAADQENQYAQLSLGLVYLKGEFVPRDVDEAKKWIGLSAGQGNEIAKSILGNIDKKHGYKPKLRFKSGKRVGFELEKALNAIKKSLKNEVEKIRNIREYELLQEAQKREEKEFDK